jgi:hypothetical protein
MRINKGGSSSGGGSATPVILDGTTIQLINGALVAKSLEGLLVTITELNYLRGLTSNVQTKLNAIANGGMQFAGISATKAILDTVVNLPSGSIKIVTVDESQSNKRMTYVWDGSAWLPLGENTIQVRDFSVNPIDLVNETVGVLPQAKMDLNGVAKTTELTELSTKVDSLGGYSGGATSVFQKVSVSVAANEVIPVVLNTGIDLERTIVQAYKFIPGATDLVAVLKTFDNSEASSFYYNSSLVLLDGAMKIKDIYNLTKVLNSESYYESEIIDKTAFRDLYAIAVN